MEKDEKVIVDTVDTSTENNEVVDPVVDSVEDETLAQTDEVIPAPEPVVDTPVTDPVVDTPVDVPPVQVENPAGDVTEPEIVNPVVDEPAPVVDPVVDAPIDVIPGDPSLEAPVDVNTEIPVEPEPVTTEPVTTGDENPTDVVVGDGGCAAGCENTCGDGGCADPVCQEPVITIGQYFGTLQECVTIAWRFHLKTRKHHVHIALNDFYDGALKVVDDIIEQYQGICGVVEEPFVNCIIGDGKSEVDYLNELKTFVETHKSILGDHSEINSTIDNLLSLIDSALYQITSFCEHAVKSFEEFIYEDYQVDEGCNCDDEDSQEEEE